jgi:hypothetical protein
MINDLPWEIILLILKQLDDYKDSFQFLRTQKEFWENNLLKKEIKEYFTKCKITDSGERWYFNGKLHREDDQPAIISPNESKEWYFNGKLHRDDEAFGPECGNSEGVSSSKPAVMWKDGRKSWFRHGNIIENVIIIVLFYVMELSIGNCQMEKYIEKLVRL